MSQSGVVYAVNKGEKIAREKKTIKTYNWHIFCFIQFDCIIQK